MMGENSIYAYEGILIKVTSIAVIDKSPNSKASSPYHFTYCLGLMLLTRDRLLQALIQGLLILKLWLLHHEPSKVAGGGKGA